jgi:hypothetical protein
VETQDFNGAGEWSATRVIERYRARVRELRVAQPRDLGPRVHEAGTHRWISPVMEAVIEGIVAGDSACIEIGIDFLEPRLVLPFGRSLHATTARALRRAALSTWQEARLRTRIYAMLVEGWVPAEFREYAKLVRRIGRGAEWPSVRARVHETNPHVMRYVRYLETHAAETPTSGRV